MRRVIKYETADGALCVYGEEASEAPRADRTALEE